MGHYCPATLYTNNMRVLLFVFALVATVCAEADADALYYGAYGAYGGAALGYPYAYARGYAAAAIPAVRTIAHAAPVAIAAAAPVAVAKAAPVVAEVRAAVPTVTSSQFHSQDEDKNYSFGYSN